MSRSLLSKAAAWISVAALALVVVGAPLFELAHGKWPGAGLTGGFSFDAIRRGAAAKELETTLERDTELTREIRPRYNEALFLALGATTDRITPGKDDWLYLSSHVRDYPPENGVKQLQYTCKALAKLVKWFEGHGTVVELMVIPRKATVYPEHLPDFERERFQPVYPEIIRRLGEVGISAGDLLGPFQASAERVFLPNDDHWDHPGALIAAHMVAERLLLRFEGRVFPGEPVAAEIVHLPSFRFAGGVVDMLGFTPGGRLVERFTVDRAQILSVNSERPNERLMGVDSPQPIVVVGTSFSAGFYTASLLVGELGRQVENRAHQGHAGGYRITDLACEILLGERAFPDVLVWEFPEEFLMTQVRALLEPAKEIVDAGAASERYRSEPLAIARRTEIGARITAETEVGIEGVNPDGRSEVVYELAEPAPGDGSLRLSYELLVMGNGLHRIRFDAGPGTPASAPVERLVLRNELPNHMLVPIKSADGSPVKRIRLGVLSAYTTFKLSPLEVWRATPAAEADGR